MRRKKGKKTRGHAGDICATDSHGEPMLKVVTFELKRGYNRLTPIDLVDQLNPPGKKALKGSYTGWLRQAGLAASAAGTPFWVLLHRRDKHKAMVIFDMRLLDLLVDHLGCKFDRPGFSVLVRDRGAKLDLVGMTEEAFFSGADPGDFRLLARRLRKGKR